jgi:hypothetical protein
MRNSILVILLAGLSTGAAAEWVKVGEFNNSALFADPAGVSRAGSVVQMSDLKIDCLDCSSIQLLGSTRYTSQTRRAEYDCKEERVRTISAVSTAYPEAGNMTENKSIDSMQGTSDWQPLSSGSIEETLWKIACGKR